MVDSSGAGYKWIPLEHGKYFNLTAVFRIRIHRIEMFLGLPDPDITQRYGSGSFYHHAKLVRSLNPTNLCFFDFLSFKKYINVPSKSMREKFGLINFWLES
jgi:hypothetical protein